MAIKSDDEQSATGNNRMSTVFCRYIISDDLINLAMRNRLADNITGHSCDPFKKRYTSVLHCSLYWLLVLQTELATGLYLLCH